MKTTRHATGIPAQAVVTLAGRRNDTEGLRLMGVDTVFGSARSQCAPIFSIPSEILSTIFKLGQAISREEENEGDPEYPEGQGVPFELLLTQVSSHFRDIAIDTPVLWSSIVVTRTRSPESVATYVARSSGHLLDVRVDLVQDRMTLVMFDTILLHSCRWRWFSLVSSQEVVLEAAGRLRNLHVPALEHLTLCVEAVDLNAIESNLEPPSPVFTGGAPRLTFVRLRGMAMHLFVPPLISVTTLHLDQTRPLPMRYTTFKEIITASPVLANLSIYGDMIHVGTESWSSILNAIELPTLRSLRICGVGGLVYSGILLGINATHLRSLVLKDVQEPDLDRFWASPQMMQFPHIISLVFRDVDLSEAMFRNMFRAFPATISFSFISSFRSFSILKLLVGSMTGTTAPSIGVPWPKLRVVTFLLNFDDHSAIEDLVEARRLAGYPLEKLRVCTIFELPSTGRFARLQESVMIEPCGLIDQWPDPIDYPDWDDDLFI